MCAPSTHTPLHPRPTPEPTPPPPPSWGSLLLLLCAAIQAELAVHKKKVAEVEQWLESALSKVCDHISDKTCPAKEKEGLSCGSCSHLYLDNRQLSVVCCC